ncbi:MAG: hypothetical protein JW748_07445 [Anaerolineales bacterium]|nr:hypothetical protein [Anaerolineales bacterium]
MKAILPVIALILAFGLAGCAVGASMCGCGLPGMRAPDRQERKSLKLSEL